MKTFHRRSNGTLANQSGRFVAVKIWHFEATFELLLAERIAEKGTQHAVFVILSRYFVVGGCRYDLFFILFVTV